MRTIRRLVAVSVTTSVAAMAITAELAARNSREFSSGIRYGASA
jgi:hypothetical protein